MPGNAHLLENLPPVRYNASLYALTNYTFAPCVNVSSSSSSSSSSSWEQKPRRLIIMSLTDTAPMLHAALAVALVRRRLASKEREFVIAAPQTNCCTQHHPAGDSHLLETIANVITSVPFVFIGLQAPRNKVATRMYADSIIGVGVVSSLYHTSRGDARKIFRWGDYAMISASALCLTRALRTENTNGLIVASALLLPFKPSLVTAIHTGLTEATFYRRVSADTRLRGVHALHTASSLLGCALFVADGMLPHTPFIHAVWHLAAAVGVATYNKLLD